MKTIFSLLAVMALAACGCASLGSSGVSPVDGSYTRVDRPEVHLILDKGHFEQGTSAIHAAGVYTFHKIAEDKYELHVSYKENLAGAEGTVIVRKEGDFVYTQDDGEGPETKFKRD